MPDIVLVLAVEELGEDLVAGDRTDGERRYEGFRPGSQDCPHTGAAFAQSPDQVERLVERDPAGDDEEDALGVEHGGHAAQGLMTSTPTSSKSGSFRVATAIRLARAVAAIMMSSFS